MKVSVGAPVKGTSFFNRDAEIKSLWRHLQDRHVLLLAPRRVGKTSLLMRLEDDASRLRDTHPVYVTVEGAQDEAGFLSALTEKISAAQGSRAFRWKRAGAWVSRKANKVNQVDIKGGVGFDSADPTLAEQAATLTAGLRELKGDWIILLDELPVFVLRLLKADPTAARARAFLEWFRSLRQDLTSMKNGSVRWCVAGSIGLDTLSRRYNLAASINDLHPMNIGPFSERHAHAYLQALAESYEISLDEAVRRRVLEYVEWFIPYYLGIFFDEIYTAMHDHGERPTPELVDKVYAQIIGPTRRAYFDTWWQRLVEQLGEPECSWAQAVLGACAADPAGRPRDALSLALAPHITDSGSRKLDLDMLLDLLVSDGYLVEEGGRFRFRTGLLRQYWLRRQGPRGR